MRIVVEVGNMILRFALTHFFAYLFITVLVMRLYEYLCVVSTIPTLNPQLAMANANTKSKTTLGSGVANLGSLTMKSNRNKISPFKADKQLLNSEMSRISKDETRNNF